MKRQRLNLPRRLLMTADTVGGVWTYALELSRELSARGVQVALATMGELATADQRAAARSIPDLVLLETDFKLEWMHDPWREVSAAGNWLLGIEESFQPDLVHLNGYVHAALPWQKPVLSVAHSCVRSWWQAVRGCPAPEDQWSRYGAEVTRGLLAADLVVAPSRAMLNAIEAEYTPLPRTEVIYNGCDHSLFEPRRKEPLIFTAGRLWDDAKNVRALDAIAANLPWPVYIAGESKTDRQPQPGKEPNSARRSSPGFSEASYLGKLPREDVAAWLARAAIYVLPARYEPFGLSILEAALSGCALVVGDIPSLREIWQNAAVYVPPDRPDLLQRELELLMQDDARRTRLAEAARRRATWFTSSRMAEGYLTAYSRLLNRATVGTR